MPHSFRVLRFSIALALLLPFNVAAPAQEGSTAPAAIPAEDLFTFSAGARFVQKPADADYADMAYTPYALIDETPHSDTRAEAGKPAVYVLELPEQTEIAAVGFDTGGPTNSGQPRPALAPSPTPRDVDHTSAAYVQKACIFGTSTLDRSYPARKAGSICLGSRRLTPSSDDEHRLRPGGLQRGYFVVDVVRDAAEQAALVAIGERDDDRAPPPA